MGKANGASLPRQRPLLGVVSPHEEDEDQVWGIWGGGAVSLSVCVATLHTTWGPSMTSGVDALTRESTASLFSSLHNVRSYHTRKQQGIHTPFVLVPHGTTSDDQDKQQDQEGGGLEKDARWLVGSRWQMSTWCAAKKSTNQRSLSVAAAEEPWKRPWPWLVCPLPLHLPSFSSPTWRRLSRFSLRASLP